MTTKCGDGLNIRLCHKPNPLQQRRSTRNDHGDLEIYVIVFIVLLSLSYYLSLLYSVLTTYSLIVPFLGDLLGLVQQLTSRARVDQDGVSPPAQELRERDDISDKT